MDILALKIISLSEIAEVVPGITYEWIENNSQKFNEMLWELGLNTDVSFEVQKDLEHRNFFNGIVQCDRYVGYERTDKAWVESEYASQAAVDKSKNNKMLIDLYRLRGQVE